MATTPKTEPIYIGIDDKRIELKGAELEIFLAQRAKDQAEQQTQLKAQEAQTALKVSAYTKLGLTPDEIDAIL